MQVIYKIGRMEEMKKWVRWILICTVISLVVIFYVMWLSGEAYKSQHPQDAVTHGIVTIYDEKGNVYYQYAGSMEMNIQDDEGEVIVILPSTGDSCFDEEGNLLP